MANILPYNMASRKLIFIRHAQSAITPGTPASRWGLTDEGRASCAQLVDQVSPFLPATFFASTEPKARVMVEGEDESRVGDFARDIAARLRSALGGD